MLETKEQRLQKHELWNVLYVEYQKFLDSPPYYCRNWMTGEEELIYENGL